MVFLKKCQKIFGLFAVEMVNRLAKKELTKLIELVAREPGYLRNGFDSKIHTFNVVAERFIEINEQLCTVKREGAEQGVNGSIARLASQVAHDIRSPLAALETILEYKDSIGDGEKQTMLHAVRRIQDIANSLLVQRKKVSTRLSIDNSPREFNLGMAIDASISEKRLEKRGIDASLAFRIDEPALGIFVAVPHEALGRLLSNLMNNAFDACNDGTAHILVEVVRDENFARIIVHDDGRGIPGDVLGRICEEGFSYGKNSGSGLGLHFARQCVASWGGTLTIDSLEDDGTSVSFTIPTVATPAWFVSEVTVPFGTNLVIVDDEEAIHDLWRLRASGIPQIHLQGPRDFSAWLAESSLSSSTMFLIDFEFSGDSVNGIDLIRRHHLEHRAILVTNHYEDPLVIKACRESNIRLLPKEAVKKISIKHQLPAAKSANVKKYVLVDDDVFVREAWELAAEAQGVDLCTYSTAGQLWEQLGDFTHDSEFFVDHDLNDSTNGLEVAARIFKKGYHRIHLATGHDRVEFLNREFLVSIRGKNPPVFSEAL